MSPTVVIMHPIPPLWGQHFCAFGECLNAATRTICAEPLRCTDQWCRQCVACDEHAEHDGIAGLPNAEPPRARHRGT